MPKWRAGNVEKLWYFSLLKLCNFDKLISIYVQAMLLAVKQGSTLK